MKQSIEQLCRIAAKKSRLIIGLMSGTSLDGLDLALCRFTGSGAGVTMELQAFETIAYEEDFRMEIREVFAKKLVDFEKLCLLNAWVARQHASMVNSCLARWQLQASDIDLLASHGQTVYHAPLHQHGLEKFGNATLQIGDGDHLAVATGIITLSDFRQKHIAAGGEGAPLAVYGDYLLFSKRNENRIMLNIGGIANFTWLPGDLDARKVFSTDTGPGNTLLDGYARKHFQQPFDADAAIARKGQVSQALLTALCSHPFFSQDLPKTTGPELFNAAYLENARQQIEHSNLTHEDTMATLTAFTANTIIEAVRKTIPADASCVLYASGGGIHNPLLMEHLRTGLSPHRMDTTAGLQTDPDAKEAVLFATLANESVAGTGFPATGNPSIPAVSMGKISFPA